MISKRNIAKTLVVLGVVAVLLCGMAGAAFAAQILPVGAKVFSSSISTGSVVSADKKLGLGEDSEAAQSTKQLSRGTDRAVPTCTVKEADALAKAGDALDKELAQKKAVNAKDYLATLDGKVKWESCTASTYGIGDGLMGSACADGTKVGKKSMGVAHKSLPLGTKLQVIYDNKVVQVTVRDRGPYIDGRDLDLQPAVAKALGFSGVGKVEYRVVA